MEQASRPLATPKLAWLRPKQTPRPAVAFEGGAATGTETVRSRSSIWKPDDKSMQASMWLVLGSVAAGLAGWAASEALRSEVLDFPHPFLFVGVSRLCSLILCRVTACFLAWRLPPPPPPATPAAMKRATQEAETQWKAASILGCMYGVQICIGGSILYHLPLPSRAAAYTLTPAAMLGAGILAGTERPGVDCVRAIAVLELGLLLTVTQGLRAWIPWEFLLLALAGDLVKVFMWVFTRNVLPTASGVPLVQFAGRVTMTAAALGFELAFMTDYASYSALVFSRQPFRLVALLVGAALGDAVKLVSELHLAQLSAVTLLGFETPLLVVGTLFVTVCSGREEPSLLGIVGVVLCLGGMGLYAVLRLRDQQTCQPPTATTDYVPLAATEAAAGAGSKVVAPNAAASSQSRALDAKQGGHLPPQAQTRPSTAPPQSASRSRSNSPDERLPTCCFAPGARRSSPQLLKENNSVPAVQQLHPALSD